MITPNRNHLGNSSSKPKGVYNALAFETEFEITTCATQNSSFIAQL